MKNILFVLILSVLFLSGCSNKQQEAFNVQYNKAAKAIYIADDATQGPREEYTKKYLLAAYEIKMLYMATDFNNQYQVNKTEYLNVFFNNTARDEGYYEAGKEDEATAILDKRVDQYVLGKKDYDDAKKEYQDKLKILKKLLNNQIKVDPSFPHKHPSITIYPNQYSQSE
jgi:hypothetical protein